MDDSPRLPKGLRRPLGNGREPEDDDEVEEFVRELARSLYNVGATEWPEDDEECV